IYKQVVLLMRRDLFQNVLFVKVDIPYHVIPLDECQYVVLQLEAVGLFDRSDLQREVLFKKELHHINTC
ncbi:MAG: hypothetical protein ACKPKO_44975, partial [Candidatus Fonsibacter sp.]